MSGPAAGPAAGERKGMSPRLVGRRVLLAVALLFLLLVAWMTLSGGLRQIPRSQTPGQKLETAAQLACGLLSLLAALTSFRLRQWARGVRAAWAASLAVTTGLSSVVWGPPMLAVGLVFTAGALLLALGIIRLLRFGGDAWR